LGASKAIPWLRAIGGTRTLWLVLAVVVLLLLVFIAAGPVVNINHVTISL